MMSAVINKPNVKGRVIVNYDKSRVTEMLEIKENFCIASEQLVLELLDDIGMQVNKIQHANQPNGIVDLILEFTGSKNQLPHLYKNLKEIENSDYGIGKINIYVPIE